MAANKIVLFQPRALTTTTTANIWSPGTTTGGTNMPENVANLYFVFRHIRIVNTTNGAIFAALWRTTTGGNTAGKEFIWGGVATAGALNANTGVSCPANSFLEWFGLARLDAADTDKFIVGGASATGLTIQGEGEIGVS
jgi:hypothetical protein